MKTTVTVLLSLIVFLAISPSVFSDGILRIPGEQGDDFICPLECIDVNVEIYDQVAITTIRNTFTIEIDSTIDAAYHYRLPALASVTGFGVWKDSILVMFELQPGQQGGEGGGIPENDPIKDFLGSNPFTAPLDSIESGIYMVYLSYAELLPYDFGVVEYRYPLYTGDYLAAPVDTIRVSVNIYAQRAIDELQVISLAENTELDQPNDNEAAIVLSVDDLEAEEDWGFDITYNQEDIGAWLYAHRSDSARAGYFMLIIEPGIVDTGEVIPKYFTFVLDRSGSMGGNKIIQARQAVLNCLDNLIERDHFNIIDFASGVNLYSDEMLVADDENLENARNYISNIRSSGGTNTYGALMEAVSQEMGENSALQIIFATDGRPTSGEYQNPEEITERVTEANENEARIFSFGIGADMNVQFLTALSEFNDGISILFDPREEAIDSIITDFYRYISTPALINPEINLVDDMDVDSLYPLELQDVSAGKQLMMFGRYGSFGSTDIELSGQTSEGDTTMVFEDMEFPEEVNENEFVPRMWAKSVIDYWVRWMRIHGEDADIKEKIIELSLEYGILSPYTEFGDPDDPDEPDDPDSGGIAVNEPEIATFRLIQTSNGLKLIWSVTGAASEVSYNVYRAFDRSGPFEKINKAPLLRPDYVDTDISGEITVFYKIEIIAGETSWMSDIIQYGELPTELTIMEVSPNPFNGTCTISYLIPREGRYGISVTDLLGRNIRTILDENLLSGSYKMVFNAGDLAGGVYFLHLKTAGQTASKKIVLIN